MNILVTGCAGFIGAHLTKKLLEKNHHITGIDNLNNYYSVELKKSRLKHLIGGNRNFDFKKADICSRKCLDKIFSKGSFDLIIHLAAQAGVRYSLTNPYVYEKSNILGTLNILESIKSLASKPNLIFASSSSVYGNSRKIPFLENDPCDQPVSLYSVTKRTNELMIKAYNHLYGIKAVCLRLFTVYGPWGRPDMAYWSFTDYLMKGKTINLYEKDTQRDFTYIDDIVDGIMKTIKLNFEFEIINLGNSMPIKLDKFLTILEQLIGKKVKVNYQKLPRQDVKTTYADISKAKKILSWQPKTDIKEGLKEFVDWYKRQSSYYHY